jgi:cytochrome c biogenesis factor
VATWAAVLLLGGATGAGLAGRPDLARALHRAGAVAAGVAVVGLAWALAEGDYTLAYVALQTDRAATWPYRIAGLWGGMAGSLLLWSALVAAWGARREVDRRARVVASALAAAFLAVVALAAWPWGHLDQPALDGLGLVPILRHPAMLYHPPLIYLGLTGLAVPFATTVGAAAAGRTDEAWRRRVRRQVLACFAALTVGMTAGAHWAYAELGWGGYWAWDPVENTALLPWLAALAALHLLRRRADRAAAVATAGALVLAVLGTTLTRSGAAPSVHAFAEDPTVGWSLVAVGAGLAAAAAVFIARIPSDAAPLGRRDRVLAAQPWLVGAALLVVLLGTVRPLVGREEVAVDGSFFASFVAPVALALAALLFVAGVVRPSRRHPGHLAHVGFLVLLAGVLGTTTGASDGRTLESGASFTVHGWEVRNDGVAVSTIDGHDAVVSTLTLLHDGREVAVLRPARVAYPERGIELAETALRSTPLGDVQVVLLDADDAGRALVEVHVFPFLVWVWWGALLLAGAAAWAAIAAPQRNVTSAGWTSASSPRSATATATAPS